MTWQVFGPLTTALGALGLAAGLFMLQRLRVRHREHTVVTTLFWREAVEEARARVLVERFRHPLSYLLLLTLALLIWAAAAGPRTSGRGERDLVLLLDASAPMAIGDRFERATEALVEAASAAPWDARSVLWCGAEVRSLLLPGEDPLLLEARLEDLEPDRSPASVERALWDLAQIGGRTRPLSVRLVGGAPVREALLERLPPDFEVARLPGAASGDEAGGSAVRGLVSLGVSDARSGRWDRVDVLALLAGDAHVEAELDGQSLAVGIEQGRLELEGLPADGGVLTLRVRQAGDVQICELVLPERRLLRVVTGGSLPAALLASLRADPAVELVQPGTPADIAVRRRGEPVGAGLPSLELVPSADQPDAFLFTSQDEDPERALLEGVLELGLDRIDATSLAEAAGLVITAGVRTGSPRGLAVWEELLGPGYDLVGGRTFPVLVARSVRWLGGVTPFPGVVAAGEPVALDLAGLEPLGLETVPPVAGRYQTVEGISVAASLQLGQVEDGAEVAAADVGGELDLIIWLSVLALLLALADGYLFRLGRTP